MKLGETKSKIHAMNPKYYYLDKLGIGLSFCCLIGQYSRKVHRKFYEGSPDLVTCKTCKKLMQKYIVRKLKNEVM